MKLGFFYFVFSLCLMGFVYGCSSPASEVSHGLSTEVVDAETGVVIRVHLANDTIGIADRVEVRVSVHWVSPVSAEFIDPDFEQFGWVIVTSHTTPLRITNGVYSLGRSYSLEPFLPGDYQIPPITVNIKPNARGDSVELKSMPISIAVESAMTVDDAQELEPLSGMIDASVFNSGTSTGLSVSLFTASKIAFVAFFVLGLLIWLVSRNRVKLTSPPSIYTLLQEIVDRPGEEEMGQYHDLHRALLLLDTELLSTSEINGFVQECERAEYSTRPETTMSSGLMAQHTLDILGQWEEGDT